MTKLTSRVRPLAPEETDAQALSRIAQGDLSALGVLYDRHYQPLLHYAERVLRNPAEAEDLVQETFLAASRAAASFDGRVSCRPWLYGIASRLMLRRGRSSARLARFLSRLTLHPRESHASPHDLLVRDEEQSVLVQALGKLSDEKRMVLVLTEVEGLSGEEVAQSLGIPLGTVWTRLHHARRQLRKLLERRRP